MNKTLIGILCGSLILAGGFWGYRLFTTKSFVANGMNLTFTQRACDLANVYNIVAQIGMPEKYVKDLKKGHASGLGKEVDFCYASDPVKAPGQYFIIDAEGDLGLVTDPATKAPEAPKP